MKLGCHTLQGGDRWLRRLVMGNFTLFYLKIWYAKHMQTYGGFHKWAYPNSWMVYNGKSWMIWGYPYFFGNLHITYIYTYIYIHIYIYAYLLTPSTLLKHNSLRMRCGWSWILCGVLECPSCCWSLAGSWPSDRLLKVILGLKILGDGSYGQLTIKT